jgi:2'-5' RNA ligase
MPLVRSFLAIPLPAEIVERTQKLLRQLSPALPQVRWCRPEAMHLTLRFFGEIPEESLENIGEVMLSVVRFHPPFQVTIAGVGAFPSAARPRVIWLGIREGEPLMALQAALAQSLEKAGLPREDRPFSPHLTLGRCRESVPAARAILEKHRETVCGTLQVERIVLFESRLQPSGAVHLPRKTVFLGCS